MAVIKNDGKRPLRRPSLKGGVMLDVSGGQERARAWPKSRGKITNPKTLSQIDWFSQAQRAARYVAPEILSAFTVATQQTPLLPRDILTMMLAGRLLAFTMPDGRTIWGQAVANDVSTALDVITPVPGAMLVRGADGWAAILPGVEGQVLTAGEVGSPPIWQENGSGGGGSWWFAPPHSSGFTYQGYDANPPIVVDHDGAGMCVDWSPTIVEDRTRVLLRPLGNPALDWSLFIVALMTVPPVNWGGVGFCVHREHDDKLLTLECWQNMAWSSYVRTGYAAIGSNVGGQSPIFSGSGRAFIRFDRVGDDLSQFISADGVSWVLVTTRSITDDLGGDPDNVGLSVCYNRWDGGPPYRVAVEAFVVTGPGA